MRFPYGFGVHLPVVRKCHTKFSCTHTRAYTHTHTHTHTHTSLGSLTCPHRCIVLKFTEDEYI